MLALFPDVFPDACLISGCVSGCLPCAPLCYLASGGSKISNKNTFSGLGLGILPPAGQRSQTKTRPGKTKHAYKAYIAYIAYILYIFYTYSICYAEDWVVDRDAAAAGQPPGQPSHPAALDQGPDT